VSSGPGSTVAAHLRLDGDESITEAVTCFVEALAREAELPHHKTYWLRLAAEEFTINIVHHGYQGPGPIWLAGEIKPDSVWLRIEDEAPAFDPRTHDHHAKLATRPAERDEGGFGLLLALHRLDEFCYEYAGGKNRSTLVMRRTIGGTPDGNLNRADRGLPVQRHARTLQRPAVGWLRDPRGHP
jgi:anti-sigma regulatory factor (Ser/Thr protein kinase)